jgi:hypothetical protein
MIIPASVVDALSGRPDIGGTDQAFPLLSVDPEGFPHVCLLSRAELDADGEEVRAAIASRQTRSNIEERGQVSLIVVVDDASHYCKLRLKRAIEVNGRMAASFEMVSHKRDSLGIALSPLSYAVVESLPALEQWETSEACIERLKRP